MPALQLYLIIIIPLFIFIFFLFLYLWVVRPKILAKRNRILLNDLRQNLKTKKNYLRSIYIGQLMISLQEVTDKIITLLEKVRQIDPDKITTITKVCNHRTFVFSIKSELKKLSDRIVNDFSALNNYLPFPFSTEDIIENKQTNLNNILELLSFVETELDFIRKQEISVFESVEEIKKLKKPDFWRNIEYWLKWANRFEDKRLLENYLSRWDQYLEAWKNLHFKIFNYEGKASISESLNIYLEKLFVFTVLEQANIRLKTDKHFLNSFNNKMKSEWCVL